MDWLTVVAVRISNVRQSNISLFQGRAAFQGAFHHSCVVRSQISLLLYFQTSAVRRRLVGSHVGPGHGCEAVMLLQKAPNEAVVVQH